ncbi:hypothetical protein CHF27_005725 [Romboutsia maritimum]|uniref:Uncharacterized protein n=1 Tax=Romboutsia maritimum TaxID=2020948 RepID=A0A371ITP1_9FIRM|nr:hypothetical protein [Romboutsia maritimum]RDY23850.1 hypothetical protein CHF27_005725 [Romboutsia maritimum]
MFIFILLISILTLIYFLSMVCIQFSHITNINLQFGMDVTKLYSDDNFKDNHHYINKLIKNSAMLLYKITNTFK